MSRKSTTQILKYEGRAGEHVAVSARNALARASKYSRKVRLLFNGISITVNKRLSAEHVLRQWNHMLESRSRRYANSTHGKAEAARRLAETAEHQRQMDVLMHIPLADNADVESDTLTVIRSFWPGLRQNRSGRNISAAR